MEGPSDRLVLKTIVKKLCPGEHRFFDLQPTSSPDFGETGTGWKGVRCWCREVWQRPRSNLTRILSGITGPELDMLIIHVDADIAFETDLQEGLGNPIDGIQRPCPPVADTVGNIRHVIARWLNYEGDRALPPQVILAIPAQDTEAWTFAAMYPGDPLCGRDDYECIHTGNDHPGYRLTLKKYGKILRRRGSGIKKPIRRYRKVLPDISQSWDYVCRICSQSQAFTQELDSKVEQGTYRT